MINKKRISLLPVKVISVISKYVNHHSSWYSSFICYNNENGFMNGRRLAGIYCIDVHIALALCKSSNNVPETTDTNMRPDYAIYVYKSYQYPHTSCYGEIKTNESTQLYRIKDFYRLALFCKEGIFKKNLNCILSFQAIGQVVTFYYMKAIANIYITIEAAKIDIPLSKQDNASILTSLNDMLALIHLHHTIDNNTNNPSTPTLPKGYVQYCSTTLPKGIWTCFKRSKVTSIP